MPSCTTMNGAGVPATYCAGNIDGDLPRVRHDRTGLAAGDARVDLAVLRVHGELADRALWHAVPDRQFGAGV